MNKYTEYSFSELIEEFTKLQANALNVIQAISESAVGDNDYITISLDTYDGSKDYQIVSYNYMKQSIDRIDSTIDLMLGLNNSSATVKLPDGSYQKVFAYKLKKEPNNIGSVIVPEEFETQSNYFFEDYLNPLLKIRFNLNDFLEEDYTRIKVKRVLLDVSDTTSLEYFNSIKNKNNIDHDTFIEEIIKKRIPYVIDEEVKDLPISSFKYDGDFTVLKVEEGTIPITSNLTGLSNNLLVGNENQTNERKVDIVQSSEITSKTTRFYQLDKLTYSDLSYNQIYSDLSYNQTREKTLTIGDKLFTKTSLFEIQTIDKNTNFISLKRLSGYDTIEILKINSLSLYSETSSSKDVLLNVTLDENLVIFFKSIDDDFNLQNTNWSPGVSFLSNDMKISWSNKVYNLTDFYLEQVYDFGQVFRGAVTDVNIPRIDAEIDDPITHIIHGLPPEPEDVGIGKVNAPVLVKENFKIDLINEHKFNTKNLEEVRKKGASKIKLKSEINQIGKSIENKKQVLNTTKIKSEIEKRGVKTELENLLREKKSKIDLYSSTVEELAIVAKNKLQIIPSPKYRIRGFFDIPAPIKNINGLQHVIAFNVRYRYLKLDSSAPSAKQFDFLDKTNQLKRASFSPWIEKVSKTKKKILNRTSGKYEWSPEFIDSGDTININQIDIPITNSEKVNIQVQSISEAGWPQNPALSKWSNVVTIEFDDNNNASDESELILKDALQEQNVVKIQTMLTDEGVNEHLLSSAIVGDEYFSHTLESMASGFFTTEGKAVNAYEKIKELENVLVTMKNTVQQVKGKLSISIIDTDESGEETKINVQNNTIIKIFAGYYTDFVTGLSQSEKKGAIVNKSYKVVIENSETTTLELITRLPGGLGEDLPLTISTPYSSGDEEYNLKRKYDQVPIVNSSVSSNETKNGIKVRSSNLQSQQLLSQFAYSRFTDIGLNTSIYSNPTDTTERYLIPSSDWSGTQQENFVWNWAWDISEIAQGNGVISDFCVHKDSPYLEQVYNKITTSGVSPLDAPSVYKQLETPFITQENGEPVGDLVYSEFRHAKYFNLLSTEVDGKKQLGYKNTWVGGTDVNLTLPIVEYPDKFGFTEGDRYLIGSRTCGSYLFFAPSTIDNLMVAGTDFLAKRNLENGESNAITIPMVFQFRMEDYYGESDNDGIIGGFIPTSVEEPENLTYIKKIGLDIYQKDETVFSFDVEVTAKYTKQSLVEKVSSSMSSIENTSEKNLSVKKTDLKSL